MKIATYTRVSTTDQSVEAQHLELRGFAAQKGWTILAEYTDVMSGAKAERPGLAELLGAIERGAIDTVLCVKLDRIARSLVNFAELVRTLDKKGVALICTSQGIDTSNGSACGKLQQNVLSAVAEFERALIQERTRAGLAVARASGKKLGRPSLLLPPKEARAAIVSQWRAEGGKSYAKLGQMLGGVRAASAWRIAKETPVVVETVEVD